MVLSLLDEGPDTISAMKELESINRTTGVQRARTSSVRPDLTRAQKPCRCDDSREQIFGPGCALILEFWTVEFVTNL
jgi:hypothetical protein